MITQIPISLKIYTDLLEELDQEVRRGYTKRNGHINRAIRLYLDVQDLRKSVRAKPQERDSLIQDFLRGHYI